MTTNVPLVRPFFSAAWLLAGSFAAAIHGHAQITRLDLQVIESPTLDGRAFGDVGAYELLEGIATGVVDPSDPRHAGIVNLELAPRTAGGLVEYRTAVEIYRPVDMTRWNGAIYHTVPNRGGDGPAEDALLEMGFATVRVGWQGDIAPDDDNITAMLPVARNRDGSPIVGTAMEEFIFDDAETVSTAELTYETASLDPGAAQLTVRATQHGERFSPSDLRWSYVDSREIRIERPAGFDGGAIYEFVYSAKDPIVMGLGFAAMRDVISFLRYEAQDEAGVPNPLAPNGRLPEWAISIGVSQSGRYLRDFLYQGFNEDTAGRIVFDGMHPNIAGSRKTFTNYAFSQPGRWQKQHEDHFFPGDQFPFSYTTLTDPITGLTDGLLERCSASSTCPKIVHSDGEAELWQGRASLVVTDPRGFDVPLPDNVRAYLIAGTRHGGGGGFDGEAPSAGICKNWNNPLELRAIRLALSVALYQWVAEGKEPPPSRFPAVANGGLVRAEDLDFPDLPGVDFSGSYNPLHALDHRTVPPREGDAYVVLVARVDEDGNMMDGILHPNLAAPIGTATGWNLRREGFGEGEQCAGAGSFFPFAMTRAARETSGDPRLSLAERYPTPESYVEATREAADRLVEERLLLPAEAERIVSLARESGIGR
jgi:hypothetical protein